MLKDDAMKNITFSADENLIEAARRRAAEEDTTLNAQFRLWLSDYAGRKFNRDEMNESSFASRWRGRFQAAERYDALAKKYLL